MKTIKVDDRSDLEALAAEAAALILAGELICLPCGGRYRILADLTNTDAVLSLMQAKHRVRAAPALVFIDNVAALKQFAEMPDEAALEIVGPHWPGPLTLRVDLSSALPSKIVKQLGKKKSRVGVRVPQSDLAHRIVAHAGVPLLVSSANRERRHGESSPAQVSRTFGARVAMFFDVGDLKPGDPSTVIEVVDGAIKVLRPGSIPESALTA